MSACGPSMSDLWDAVEEETQGIYSVAENVKYKIGDRNIEALLSQVEAYLQFNHDGETERAFLNESKKAILDKCTTFLTNEKLRAHETFLHRFSTRRNRDSRLKIFSTNYDLCFEKAAANLGLVVIDGFSFGKPRKYDPRYFGYDIVRRADESDHGSFLEGVFLLFKLHGSVNWARNGADILEVESPTPEDACLIYPASGKYQQAFLQPHLESISQYMAALRRPNTCVLVAGFGFNDDHLSEPLLAAARSNPHMRLIIVDYGAISKSEGSPNEYWKELFKLSSKGSDIWFIDGSFEAFANIIPDLRALTSAEKLKRAVLDAASESPR